ncbi:phosphoserine phosphatase SerB [Denitromonas iodatirespirans]|uniref:Phosphoserine phosphatase n=1 Tax=Denitromonas iodatirespirans TaxID=2795389 RepID=A0A944H8N5_DENI1|nr:phosphoserine phosphatase SerB [Denitromonas iodatirespirans]MBT0961570.1 phosphoserine phosphatase SerB [Denitromonas iodatirespirans]
MNLVVFGPDIETPLLKQLARHCDARAIEQIDPAAFRLVEAQRRDGVAELCDAAGIDYAFVPAKRRLADFGLFVTDMDSTLIDIECIDEIADQCGKKHQVAEITEAAMRGEIDFRESLTRRVAQLAGLDAGALETVFRERLRLNPGAERLLATLKANGIVTVLVSGGFTYFTDRLKAQLGFDHAYANTLEVVDGKLTGKVTGPVVDAQAKADHLSRIRDQLDLSADRVMAAGDGANDLPMFQAAGFRIAYQAKPVLRAQADCSLRHSGLDAVLKLFA